MKKAKQFSVFTYTLLGCFVASVILLLTHLAIKRCCKKGSAVDQPASVDYPRGLFNAWSRLLGELGENVDYCVCWSLSKQRIVYSLNRFE